MKKIGKWFRSLWRRDRAWLERELLLSLTDPQGALREAVLRVVRGVAKDVAGDAMEPILDRALCAFEDYVKQETAAVESVPRETGRQDFAPQVGLWEWRAVQSPAGPLSEWAPVKEGGTFITPHPDSSAKIRIDIREVPSA